MGKFLVFEKVGEEIQVHNQKGDFLGYLYFDTDWKKPCFNIEGFRFDAECLDDLSAHLKEMKK
jgi:hypothetical protein